MVPHSWLYATYYLKKCDVENRNNICDKLNTDAQQCKVSHQIISKYKRTWNISKYKCTPNNSKYTRILKIVIKPILYVTWSAYTLVFPQKATVLLHVEGAV